MPPNLSRGVTQDLITLLRTTSCPPKLLHNCLLRDKNTQIHKYKPPAAQQDCCTIVFSGTQIQIHNYKYKNTTHKYTNTNHQLPTKTVAQLSSQGHKGAKCHLLPSFLISLRVLDCRRIQRSKISQSCRCKLANPQMCNVLTKNEKGKMSTKNYPAKLLLL